MKQGEALNFLTSIWSKQCKAGEYVFLCVRDPKKKKWSWRDFPIQYTSRPAVRKAVKELLTKYSPDKYDIYFCPLPFKKPKRDKDLVTRSKFLWQDLDYADPKKFKDKGLFPTVYWESSPGRFHGLWELEKQHKVKPVETLNRDLAYMIGADKGGWDLTQVLRVPGTRNHKYDNKPVVKIRHSHGKPLIFKELRKKVEHVEVTSEIKIESRLEEKDPQEILNRYSGKLPRDLLTTLLQKEVPVGKRSEVIWSLEHRLYEIGLTPDEIFTLIKHSAWNKYRGRRDEDERLTKELQKIISKSVAQVNREKEYEGLVLEGTDLRLESYREVMGNIHSYPGWLIEGFWARRSHGIVAGEPKAFKSTFTLDLAVSVASGAPFLGKYPVNEPGPVIIVQNENTEWLMKDKTEKVITHRGLVGKVERLNDNTLHIDFPPEIPLYFINQQGYMLDNPEHQKAMETIIEKIKPVLVIFDPLYLMFEGDINSARDLNPVLNWLLRIKNEYKTGVMLIHHYNKGSGISGGSWKKGQRMLGSTTLHGWIESAWYLQVNQPETNDAEDVDKSLKEPSSIFMEREFRTAGNYPKIELKLSMGQLGDPYYHVTAEIYKEEGATIKKKLTPADLAVEIVNLMESKMGTVSWNELSELTGIDRMNLLKEAAALAASTDSSLKVTKLGIKRTKKRIG